MPEKTMGGTREGLGFGIIAGLVFAVAQIAVSAISGNSALLPLRAASSVLLGSEAIEGTSIGTAIIVGTLVHLVLSAVYGVIYTMINAKFSIETETSWGRQLGLGMLYGAVIWFVNFQIIARMVYPWFLAMSQFLQLVMHAVFFGVPLALMLASAQRRIHPAVAHRHVHA